MGITFGGREVKFGRGKSGRGRGTQTMEWDEDSITVAACVVSFLVMLGIFLAILVSPRTDAMLILVISCAAVLLFTALFINSMGCKPPRIKMRGFPSED